MKQPISLPSFGKKQSDKNYYLILLLRDEKATAVILAEENKTVQIAGMNETHFTTPLEETTDDALLDILDKTISKAEETLPPSIQTEMTVFGVKDSWVEDKKIKKEFLDRLKSVGKALSLKPIGFLVISEAIAHLIQQEEGAPVSAIVAEIGKYSVMLSLFRGGRLLETKSAPVEHSLPQTVDMLLKHFVSVEVLPSRILLLNADEDDSLSQQFITHHWSKTLPFLHMPQISVLSNDFDARAAVQGAANQMEFSVVDTGFPLTSSITTLVEAKEKPAADTEVHSLGTEAAEHDKQQHEKNEKDTEDLDGNNDASITTEKEHSGISHEILPASVATENFGFVEGKDIADLPFHPVAQPKTLAPEFQPASFNQETTFTNDDKIYSGEEPSRRLNQSKGKGMTSVLTFFTSFIAKISGAMKKMPVRGIAVGGNVKWIGIAVLLLLILIAAPIMYMYTASADVTLDIKAKAFDDSEDITFSVDGSSDFKNNTIKATTVSVSLDDKATVPASGKKEVGDKAKGSVTIYNNNENKRTLSAGTVLTSSNSLQFTLDKDVTVSSASGDAFSGTKPGTAQASVTASSIGTDSNLPSGTKFSVSGTTSVVAKNDAAFSGGTKKDVTVVAKADRDKLLLQIPKDLETKAKDELAKKLSGGDELLPLDLTTSIDKKEFDKNVGDEAKTVTASVTVSFSGIAYSKTELQDFAKAIIETKASSDANTPDSTINTGITKLKTEKDSSYSASVAIKTGLLPKVDTEKIKHDITGKSVSSAVELLKKLPQVESVSVKVNPGIPVLSSYLPRQSDHIKVLTSSHE
jgi:hypothetical protein